MNVLDRLLTEPEPETVERRGDRQVRSDAGALLSTYLTWLASR